MKENHMKEIRDLLKLACKNVGVKYEWMVQGLDEEGGEEEFQTDDNALFLDGSVIRKSKVILNHISPDSRLTGDGYIVTLSGSPDIKKGWQAFDNAKDAVIYAMMHKVEWVLGETLPG